MTILSLQVKAIGQCKNNYIVPPPPPLQYILNLLQFLPSGPQLVRVSPLMKQFLRPCSAISLVLAVCLRNTYRRTTHMQWKDKWHNASAGSAHLPSTPAACCHWATWSMVIFTNLPITRIWAMHSVPAPISWTTSILRRTIWEGI